MKRITRGLTQGIVALLVFTGTRVTAQSATSSVTIARESTCAVLQRTFQAPDDLQKSMHELYHRSPMFRHQVARIVQQPSLVIAIRWCSPCVYGWSGRTQITRTGGMLTRVEVNLHRYRFASLFELLGHELEHVVEQIEGIDLRNLSARHATGVVRVADAYETDRAYDAGRIVAREYRKHRGARATTSVDGESGAYRVPDCNRDVPCCSTNARFERHAPR